MIKNKLFVSETELQHALHHSHPYHDNTTLLHVINSHVSPCEEMIKFLKESGLSDQLTDDEVCDDMYIYSQFPEHIHICTHCPTRTHYLVNTPTLIHSSTRLLTLLTHTY